MSHNINIVVVEDDTKQQGMYKDTIDIFNLANAEFTINYECMINDDYLPKYLFENKCDCLILDLNWGSGALAEGGNRLLSKIIKSRRIPVLVISGNLEQLSQDYEESLLFKTYQRDVDFNLVIERIVEIYNTGYTNALGNRGKIDEVLTNVFWGHLNNNVNEWEKLEPEVKERRLLRYTLTRMNELLGVVGESSDIHNSIEFYIKPSLRNKPFSGDIIEYNGKSYVIISASCDMEQAKTDFVVMCCIDFENFDALKGNIKVGAQISSSSKSKLNALVNNNVARFHLLPPCREFTGGKVDFQQIFTIVVVNLSSVT